MNTTPSHPIAKRAIRLPEPQITLLILLVVLYLLVAVVYALMPGGALAMATVFDQTTDLAPWQIALGNAGIILVLYIPVGLAGLWLSRKAGLPGTFRIGGTFKEWFLRPLGIGLVAGILMVGVDWTVQRFTDFTGFLHPPFLASILASFTAGVGEEILFRLFFLTLWVLILRWLLGRFLPSRNARNWSLWIANILAALAFAASHLGTAMVIAGVETPAALSAAMLVELVLLNGLLGLLAGRAFIRDGLIAAAGVHFWADMVWHVLYGLLNG